MRPVRGQSRSFGSPGVPRDATGGANLPLGTDRGAQTAAAPPEAARAHRGPHQEDQARAPAGARGRAKEARR